MIDTHCHIDSERYDEDRDAVIARAKQAGITHIMNPGIDLETSQAAVGLTSQYDMLYAAVGIQPNSSADFHDAMIDRIAELATNPKVVAIGEIGLDYYWDKSPKERQFAAFEEQLALATRLELPVIIHNREASQDVLSILETWTNDLPVSIQDRLGVLHSFSASADIAQRALNMGFYLGFTGPITFKKAETLRQVAKTTPLDRILVETDGPFLTPEPYRSKRKNEPAYIPYIVERLAELKGLTTEEMAEITSDNAVRLFHLPRKPNSAPNVRR